MAEKVTLVIPYSEVTWGRVYLDCVIDDGVTKEDFIAGVKAGTIEPFAFAHEGEEWSADDSTDLDLMYQDMEVIENESD